MSIAATQPAIPTSFWDRAPKPTSGRLRRVLSQVHCADFVGLPEQFRKKQSPTRHLPKGVLGHRRQRQWRCAMTCPSLHKHRPSYRKAEYKYVRYNRIRSPVELPLLKNHGHLLARATAPQVKDSSLRESGAAGDHARISHCCRRAR